MNLPSPSTLTLLYSEESLHLLVTKLILPSSFTELLSHTTPQPRLLVKLIFPLLEGTSIFIGNTAYYAGGGLFAEYSNVSAE